MCSCGRRVSEPFKDTRRGLFQLGERSNSAFCWLVGFYGISTFVADLMPIHVYVYIDICDLCTKSLLLADVFLQHISLPRATLPPEIREGSQYVSIVLKWYSSYYLLQPCLSQERQNVIRVDVLEYIAQTVDIEKSLSDKSELTTFYDNVFNCSRRLTRQTLVVLPV